MLLRSLRRVVQRAAAPRCLGGGCSGARLATHVLNVPAMGDSITEGTVASVEKAVGDAVAVDEIVAVIDTDKVSVDVALGHGGRRPEFVGGGRPTTRSRSAPR